MLARATRQLTKLGRFFGLGRLIGLLLLAAFVVVRVADPFPVEILRLKTFDTYQTIKPRTVTSGAVVVVDIDEKSLREVGQWPWPRTTIADLVARITEKGPAVIGFDVLFAEPDRLSPALVVSALRIADPEIRAKLEAMPGNETVFAESLRRSRVVLGQAGHHTKLESA
jgi:adenylate cyclase